MNRRLAGSVDGVGTAQPNDDVTLFRSILRPFQWLFQGLAWFLFAGYWLGTLILGIPVALLVTGYAVYRRGRRRENGA